jgi:hypothetical protein
MSPECIVHIRTPALNSAVRNQGTGVDIVRRDGSRTDRANDCHRCRGACRDRASFRTVDPVSELAFVVGAPALNRATSDHHAGVGAAHSNAGRARDTSHGHRREAACAITKPIGGGGSGAKLPPIVAAPALDRTAGEKNAREAATRRNYDSAAHSGHCDRRRGIRGGAISKLSIGVVTPALDRSVRQNRASVLLAGGHRDCTDKTAHRHGRRRIPDCAVSELANGALAPALDGTIGEYGAGVKSPMRIDDKDLHLRWMPATAPKHGEQAQQSRQAAPSPKSHPGPIRVPCCLHGPDSTLSMVSLATAPKPPGQTEHQHRAPRDGAAVDPGEMTAAP